MSRLATIYTRGYSGLNAPLITIEVHISPGLPKLIMVGLAEAEVKESKERVRSAIINSNLEFPNRRVTVNLAPADLPKTGGRYDLPIALGILVASGQLSMTQISGYEFAGELALSGTLRCINAVLPFVIATRNAQNRLILPLENCAEASLLQDNIIYGASTLHQVVQHLQGNEHIAPYKSVEIATCFSNKNTHDIADIHGQLLAKRALEIAAAGGHNLLMVGPPGTGKTMLATRIPTILPLLTNEQALEVAAIYSLASTGIRAPMWRMPPFRAPHHTASAISLVGGGSAPKPGEITLAHNGVLFLDELPEFGRQVLEVLREPIESGFIEISRAIRKTTYPARFQLVAAMNPCPCGHLGNPLADCRCNQEQISRYQAKLSAPLLERFDIYVDVPILNSHLLLKHNQGQHAETSSEIRTRVEHALKIQYMRNNKLNAHMTNEEVKQLCKLDQSANTFLSQAIEKLQLSARSFYRIIKVARTIADLGCKDEIDKTHMMEAIGFRSKLNSTLKQDLRLI